MREKSIKANHYENVGQKVDEKSQKNEGVPPRIIRLYAQSLTIVSREIRHLKNLSIAEKLESKYAGDLIGYVRLLGEMKKQHIDMKKARDAAAKEMLEQMSQEELEEKVKELLKKRKK